MDRTGVRTAPLVVLSLIALVAAGCGTESGGPSATSAPASEAAESEPAASPTEEVAAYPERAITIVIPTATGGGLDRNIRTFATYAAEQFGVPINVVNVEGAAGITGALQALEAEPDGYTLLGDAMTWSSTLTASRTDIPEGARIEDREFLGKTTADQIYFLASTEAPWKTLDEAMDAARSDPGAFTWGAGAPGSPIMYSQLQLFQAADVPFAETTMVTFDGNGPALTALSAGDVLFGVTSASTDVENLTASGLVRVLAVTGENRTAQQPDVPTAAELGYEGVNLGLWAAISGPVGMPGSVYDAWQEVLGGAVTDAEFLAIAEELGMNLDFVPGDEFMQFVIDEAEALTPLAIETGIRE